MGGFSGFDPDQFDSMLTAYERWAYGVRPEFGRAVSTIIDAHWRGPVRRPGLGDGEDWSAGDITPIDMSAFDTFTPADSSGFDSSGIFDGGTIEVTGQNQSGGTDSQAIDWTPWFDGTALTPVDVTPIDFGAIAQDFANWTPAGSSLADKAKAVAAALGGLAAKAASALGGAAGGASGGAAALQKAATPQKPVAYAGLGLALLAGLAVMAVAYAASN